MVKSKTRNRLRKTAIQLGMAGGFFASLGAVVVAAPAVFNLKPHLIEASSTLQPLAGGPALQLAKAGAGASEDCVRVTRMVGPDGNEYPTNGMVCGGE